MSEQEQQALLHKHFSTEQVVCLEYVAKRAAQDVMREHGDSCPFERKVYGVAGKAALGFLALLVMVGAVIYGSLKARIP